MAVTLTAHGGGAWTSTLYEGNKGYGILIEEDDDGSASSQLADSVVEANGFCGFRVEDSCFTPPAFSWPSKENASSVAADALLSSNKDPKLNGQRLDACSRCRCEQEGNGTVVDCTDDGDGRPPNFGTDFFARLPANTSRLLMASTNLVQIDWRTLEAASDSLEILDLSGNPRLENAFPNNRPIVTVNGNTGHYGVNNLRFNEDTSMIAGGHPTWWSTDRRFFFFWCKEVEAYMFTQSHEWLRASQGGCYGFMISVDKYPAMTRHDFWNSKWRYVVGISKNSIAQNLNITWEGKVLL